jgi:hypothetical protein
MKLGLITVALVLVGCGKDLSSLTTSTSSSGTTAVSAAAVAPKEKTVDLAPLPLTLTMAADEMAMAMDMSMGENKSVSVSYEAVSAGINVSVPLEKSFAALKKEHKGDTILFPFKRWVKESDTSAIEEFTNEGKSAYMALSWKQVGGKPYVCKSNGLSGLKSADDAEKVLKTCDTLAPK